MDKSLDNINESLRDIKMMLQNLITKLDSGAINPVSFRSAYGKDQTNASMSAEATPSPVKRMTNTLQSWVPRSDSGEALQIRSDAVISKDPSLISRFDSGEGFPIKNYSATIQVQEVLIQASEGEYRRNFYNNFIGKWNVSAVEKIIGQKKKINGNSIVTKNEITISNGNSMFSDKDIEKIVQDTTIYKAEDEEHKKKVKMKDSGSITFQLSSTSWQQHVHQNLGFDCHIGVSSSSSSTSAANKFSLTDAIPQCLHALCEFQRKKLENFSRKEEMVDVQKLFDEMPEKNTIQDLGSLWIFCYISSQVIESSPHVAIVGLLGELVTEDGRQYSWGRGIFGRVDNGSESDELFPVPIKFGDSGNSDYEKLKFVGVVASVKVGGMMSALWMSGNCPQKSSSTENSFSRHATVYVEGDKYYGAKATINVCEPKIQQPNEFGLSQLWILGGPFSEDLNSIEAGWQVSPYLYGDKNTRLFTYWTSDAYQATGCYNLLCSGFIQLNSEIAMGASISHVSAYRNSRYDINILIWNDTTEGHWWMQFGSDCVLCYWPSFLLSYLADSASMIEWRGEIVNSEPDGEHTSTQMGSGHFPEEFGKAGYSRNIQLVDGSNNLKPPQGIGTFIKRHWHVLSYTMEKRVGLLFLFLLGAFWSCDARQLGKSELSVFQLRKQEKEKESQFVEQFTRNDNLCTLCEEFAAKAVDYFAENKTQAEIMDKLHLSCSSLPAFKEQCITLVDYYAPIFFLEISTTQPA